MSREVFLQQAAAAALPVHPVTVCGIAFHVRETSVLDVRLAIERRALDADKPQRHIVARQLAAVMLSPDGVPLFDQDSEADMQTLGDAIDRLPSTFGTEVNQARAAFDKPATPEEVDAEGNSPRASD